MLDRIRQYRRDLHQIPELGRELPETLRYVEHVLRPLGCRVFSPSEGALCAWFDAGRARTTAFRADMDALPVEEHTGASYCSRHPGRMHACGHDGHTAMMLELANRIADRRNGLTSNVLLIFQPAEETDGGARQICQSGVLEEYRVNRIFGLHLWPGLPAGTLWTRPGAMMAKNSEVNVIISGRSIHITKYAQGVDALAIGAEALERIYAMAAEELPPEELRVLRFGRMVSGTVRNALSARTELQGTLRVFSMDTFRFLTRRCREILAELENRYGCKAEAQFSEGYPPVCNSPELVQAVRDFLGEAAPSLLPQPDLTAEDFSFYQQRLPGLFCFLGVGDTAPLHAAEFDFDESVLEAGVSYYERLLELPENV